MPNAVNKVKHLSTDTNFWEETEISEQLPQDLLTEAERPVRALLELPHNWWSSHSSIGANNKLKKLDLIRLHREKFDKQNLPIPVDWELADGDYLPEIAQNEEHQVYSMEGRKRLEKISFGVALVFASLMILLFSFLASSIKNF